MMNAYRIGERFGCSVPREDGVQFDITDAGAVCVAYFNNPSSSEIAQFGAGTRLEVRFAELSGIIMMTLKIGSLEWMDAPYTPHLSRNLTRLEIPDAGEGLALTLLLVDAGTGIIRHIRFAGLSERFSRRLIGAVTELKAAPFSEPEFRESLRRIYGKYATKDIVRMSRDCCRIGGQE